MMRAVVRRGGKRALLRSALTWAAVTATGARRHVAPVRTPVRRLVFVCAGNICRSPFGEYFARQLGLPAVSMGLQADPGKPANPSAARHAAGHGVDLSAHRSQRVSAEALRPDDLVLGFELWHVEALEALAGPSGPPVRLLGGYAGSPHLFDPYGLSDEAFACSFERIARAVRALQGGAAGAIPAAAVDPARTP